MLDFTVAIPTYNGANRLPLVLDKLKAQTGTENISWEIVVIDNNSNDDTAKVVKEYQADWLSPYPLNYCFEPQQGSAFARVRAIQEAKGELVGFLDDDNLPASEWVAEAYYFAKDRPLAGAYSGQIHGQFEVKPQENLEKIYPFLAIREHGKKSCLFEPDKLRLPPTAGLVVRQQAWVESVPLDLRLIGRVKGNVGIGGEDYEVLLYMHKAGWQIWYNPAMHIDHLIPQWRLERDYLLSLARGCGLATCRLRLINAVNWQKPIVILRTLLGNLRRIILHLVKYRGKVKTDLIAAFELHFFWGSLMSCFYLGRKP